MYPPSRDQFEQFLGTAWDCTNFLEFRVEGKLIGCAVMDVLPNALSAIYTYFDPEESVRSSGYPGSAISDFFGAAIGYEVSVFRLLDRRLPKDEL